jgi:hypothetical protein
MAAAAVHCRYCYAVNPCKHCGNLEFYELRKHRRIKLMHDSDETGKPRLSFKDIKENVKNCKFCAILYDSIYAVGWTTYGLHLLEFELCETLVLTKSAWKRENQYGLGHRLEFFTLDGESALCT